MSLALLAASSQAAPELIRSGVYVQDIYDLDPKTSTYHVFFYLWFRWSGKVDPRNFQLMNGTIDERMPPYYQKHGDEQYVLFPIRATLHGHFKYGEFPRDHQDLTIVIEDSVSGIRHLRYVVDDKDSRQNPRLTLQDYTVGKMHVDVLIDSYETAWGENTPLRSTSYSRLQVTIPIEHAASTVYLKMFLAVFIATAIGFLCLFIPVHVEALFVIGVGAIFGIVSSWAVYNNGLPSTSEMTMGDKLHLLSLLFVFFILVICAIRVRLAEEKKIKESDTVARVAGWVMIPLYALLAIWMSL